MKYLLLTLVLLSIVNASMRWSSDPDDVLPLINDDKKEDLKMDTESFDSASDFEDFPYDTSLLWAPRASKSVRFDLTGTKEGEKMLLNHITQTSPDTVTKLFDLSSSFGELIDEDPISNKVVISVEWIKELLIPCFKADDMIPIELVKQVNYIVIVSVIMFMFIFRLLLRGDNFLVSTIRFTLYRYRLKNQRSSLWATFMVNSIVPYRYLKNLDIRALNQFIYSTGTLLIVVIRVLNACCCYLRTKSPFPIISLSIEEIMKLEE